MTENLLQIGAIVSKSRVYNERAHRQTDNNYISCYLRLSSVSLVLSQFFYMYGFSTKLFTFLIINYFCCYKLTKLNNEREW